MCLPARTPSLCDTRSRKTLVSHRIRVIRALPAGWHSRNAGKVWKNEFFFLATLKFFGNASNFFGNASLLLSGCRDSGNANADK